MIRRFPSLLTRRVGGGIGNTNKMAGSKDGNPGCVQVQKIVYMYKTLKKKKFLKNIEHWRQERKQENSINFENSLFYHKYWHIYDLNTEDVFMHVCNIGHPSGHYWAELEFWYGNYSDWIAVSSINIQNTKSIGNNTKFQLVKRRRTRFIMTVTMIILTLITLQNNQNDHNYQTD